MPTTQPEAKTGLLRTVLGALQILIGIGAVGGGLALILDPSGSLLGIPLEVLGDSPFPDFLVPGLVLLIVNGVASLIGGLLTLRCHPLAGEIAAALGIFLMAWIVAQVWWIGLGLWVQQLYFVLGAAELVLGLILQRTSKWK
jgi:hypothetical protein